MSKQTTSIIDKAIGLRSLPNRPVPLKTGKTATTAHVILSNSPKPIYRFTTDATVVMSTHAAEPRDS